MSCSFWRARQIFLFLLSGTYGIAFYSFYFDALGLLGSTGAQPASSLLAYAKSDLGVFQRIWLFPTVFWLDASDTTLQVAPLLGCLCAALALIPRIRPYAFAGCWLLYLSIVTVGGAFFQFQWDSLLLESGFLAIFFSRYGASPREECPESLSNSLLLLKLLTFRLLFSSGISKLLSDDPSWRMLTSLRYHFETQPLPTPLAYYLDKLPLPALQLACGLLFFVEVILPFFLFAGPRLRRFAAISSIALQLAILLSGNFAFFNLLTIALCILFLDDAVLRTAYPNSLATLRPRLSTFYGVGILFLSIVPMLHTVAPRYTPPSILSTPSQWLQPFRIVHSYGLFSVMTRERLLVVLEGSHDGLLWQEIYYKWQPQKENEGLPFIAPFHPRLDWQAWFIHHNPPQRIAWFSNVVSGLLKHDPSIRTLFRSSQEYLEPNYIRALLYRYEFTSRHNRKIFGKTWDRVLLGIYMHPVSLASEEASSQESNPTQ